MKAEGKIVARLDQLGGDYGDALLVVFTDGTALEVTGSSYEEVSLSAEMIDAAAIVEHAHEEAICEDKRRTAAQKRAEWEALPHAERVRITAERRAAMSPFSRAVQDEMTAAVEASRRMMNKVDYGEVPGRARRS